MKEFAAFILLILLVLIGWNQPYKAHFSSVTGKPLTAGGAGTAATGSPARAAGPKSTPASDSSWLWKRSKLDLPEGRTAEDKHGR